MAAAAGGPAGPAVRIDAEAQESAVAGLRSILPNGCGFRFISLVCFMASAVIFLCLVRQNSAHPWPYPHKMTASPCVVSSSRRLARVVSDLKRPGDSIAQHINRSLDVLSTLQLPATTAAKGGVCLYQPKLRPPAGEALAAECGAAASAIGAAAAASGGGALRLSNFEPVSQRMTLHDPALSRTGHAG